VTEIILGSQSPRRKEILDFFSLPFRQISPQFDETQVAFHKDPIVFVKEVAERKALCLIERFPHTPIITADTIVFCKERLFLKPETIDEARSMLSELSGKEHEVYTGICVAQGSKYFSDFAKTVVEFHELTEAQIDAYHRYVHPLDKAGSYAIQKGGSLIVKRIDGCYYNIMGLPLQPLRRLLLNVGIDLWDHLKPSVSL
jgi:septum formation protein